MTPGEQLAIAIRKPLSSENVRLTAGDFHPEVLRLFDQYVHGVIDRRGFLERAATFAVGTSAAALLDALNPKFAQAQQVTPSDSRIKTEFIEFKSPKGYGSVRAYLTRPAKPAGKLPAVLVVHENRGLNPHIEDIARRLALDNFLALAPDALFPLGGYPGDEDKARELFSKLDQEKAREDFIAAAKFLKHHAESNGKLGTVGFCYGGGVVHFSQPSCLSSMPALHSTACHRHLRPLNTSKQRSWSIWRNTMSASTPPGPRMKRR